MVQFIGYMLRDKATGRWHNWGGLTEWLPNSNMGGTLWTDRDAAYKFAREYKVLDVEVVPVSVKELPPHVWPDAWELAKEAKYTGVMPNDPATEFALFKSGELVKKITKEEALALLPGVRTFAIGGG